MINKTELNKLRSHIDHNKKYLDEIQFNGDDNKKHSVALTMSILMDYFSLNQNEALESVTDEGEDNKIDRFYYSDDEEELSHLVIIQSKYKNTDASTGTFSEDEIKLCIKSCIHILQGKEFQNANQKLKDKILSYRQLLKDNNNPPVSISLFFATNGLIHENHKKLDEVFNCSNQNITPIFVDATKYGEEQKMLDGYINSKLKDDSDETDSVFDIEENGFAGKIISCQSSELMRFYKETGTIRLLNQNVRYLLKKSKINQEIANSFKNNPEKFCYLNNGITIVCKKFTILPTAQDCTKIELEKPSIVNGGQTVSTLYSLYELNEDDLKKQFDSAYVLIRIYKVPESYMLEIAKATNSQNPINIVDLNSNDKNQLKAKRFFAKQGVGLIVKVGEDIEYYDDVITNENLLQVYAALYCDDPAKAKLSKRFIFNKYYSEVFNDNIDDQMIDKLFRSYQIKKYIEENVNVDKSLKNNCFYALVYAIKLFDRNLLNTNIPEKQLNQLLTDPIADSLKVIKEIVYEKQSMLGEKFSLNNVFKNNEIKDLLDLKVESVLSDKSCANSLE